MRTGGSTTGKFAGIALALAGALLFALPAQASAATITVDTGDDGPAGCTLRAAMRTAELNANQNDCSATGLVAGGEDTVVIPASVDPFISLDFGFGPLTMDVSPTNGGMEVVGPGASQVTVSGGHGTRVFEVGNGPDPALISGITIAQGSAMDSGAGLFNGGAALTLEDVVVEENDVATLITGGGPHGVAGGGIHNVNGALTLRRSTVRNNTILVNVSGDNATALADGAGINTLSNVPVTIEDSTIGPGNLATAITEDDDTATGSFGRGGGIYAGGSGANNELLIQRSTIAGNTAEAMVDDVIHLDDVTQEDGGGIYTNVEDTALPDDTGTTFNSATVAFNRGTDTANIHADNNVFFRNSLVSNPAEGNGLNCAGGGPLVSLAFNLEGSVTEPGTCGFGDLTDQVVADAGITGAGFGANGGPTHTVALLPGSPAIDQGRAPSTLVPPTQETTDQRGLPRPVDFSGLANDPNGDGSDIGAFEFQQACTQEATPGAGGCPSGVAPPPAETGLRAAALKKCKKKPKKKRKKCRKKAKKLPV